MKLLTEPIQNRLKDFPFRSQEDKGDNAIIICKFFFPAGAWTWYVMEAEQQENEDYIFFGLVINGYGEHEFGYFQLSELESIVATPFRLKVERDKYFDECLRKDLNL